MFVVQNVVKSGAMSPPTKVTAKVTRRRFSAKYKMQILDEAAACTARGEIGALLRREGLYSSHLGKWRQQTERGQLAGLQPKKRGPVAQSADPRDKRVAELEKELNNVTRRAERAEALVEIQKKDLAAAGHRPAVAGGDDVMVAAVMEHAPEPRHRRHVCSVRRGAADVLPQACRGPRAACEAAGATANTEARERRDLARHPVYERPELLATKPNQLWSWDITKLKGPTKWTYFQLYVIFDVFSRYVVGWMVASRESANLAKRLIAETCRRQGIEEVQLTLHADRGTSMKSKRVAFLLADLGVTKSHSRPHVSDDNPCSEAQFKTLNYRPDFPKKFGCIQDSRTHCIDFFARYNDEHQHSGLAMFTPAEVHYGRVEEQLTAKQAVVDAAFEPHPDRFPHRRPVVKRPRAEVWINPPWPAPVAPSDAADSSSVPEEVRP